MLLAGLPCPCYVSYSALQHISGNIVSYLLSSGRTFRCPPPLAPAPPRHRASMAAAKENRKAYAADAAAAAAEMLPSSLPFLYRRQQKYETCVSISYPLCSIIH